MIFQGLFKYLCHTSPNRLIINIRIQVWHRYLNSPIFQE